MNDHVHNLFIDTLYYAPAWMFLVMSLLALIVLFSVAIRWHSFVLNRWDALMLCAGLLGIVIFDMLNTFSLADEHTLVATSRAMRVISSMTVFWVAHSIIIRQRRQGIMRGWWK